MGKKVAKQEVAVIQQEEVEEGEIQDAAGDEAEAEGTPYQDVMELQNTGVSGFNANDLQKLKDCGYPTVQAVMMATVKELIEVKGITDLKIEKMREAIKKLNGQTTCFVSGLVVKERRSQIKRLTTGSKAFDAMLGGGIESASITEVYGEFRSGKTQLVHTMCVTAQLPRSQNGGAGKVLYLDTEGTFRTERIGGIAEHYGLDGEEVLENIVYARAYSVEHQNQILGEASKLMFETGPFALIVVDSIMALFRVDFSGRGELSERQQVLGQTLKRLLKLAETYNVAILITNQVMADPSGQGNTYDPKKPVGGHVLAHASTTRIYLKKGKQDERKANLVDSPHMKEDEIVFKISDAGVVDV